MAIILIFIIFYFDHHIVTLFRSDFNAFVYVGKEHDTYILSEARRTLRVFYYQTDHPPNCVLVIACECDGYIATPHLFSSSMSSSPLTSTHRVLGYCTKCKGCDIVSIDRWRKKHLSKDLMVLFQQTETTHCNITFDFYTPTFPTGMVIPFISFHMPLSCLKQKL